MRAPPPLAGWEAGALDGELAGAADAVLVGFDGALAGTEEPCVGTVAGVLVLVESGPSVTKTPGESAAGLEATTALEVGLGAEPGVEPGVDSGVAAGPAVAQLPVGLAKLGVAASLSTTLPGSGKIRSVDDTVPQPLPMLATNMLGRAS